jgi:hypothetical protein
MARTPIHVRAQLVDILCRNEADGPGNAEPYLWPVFFKVDGDSYAFESVGLIGFPTVVSSNGQHGNLGDTDVDEGDRVLIPETLGMLETELKPIPVNDPFFRSQIGDDTIPGFVGAVAVLMEQDSWPDDFTTTGYDALVDAIRLGVGKMMASFQHATHVPTKDEIDAQIAGIKDLAHRMVRGAILNHMSGSQIAWYGSAGNNDDQIGVEGWFLSQDDFADTNSKTFSRRWTDDESDGNGDWEITVRFTNLDASVVVPAECVKLMEAIKSLEEELLGVTDINDRKRILQEIGNLKNRSLLIGCPAA